MARVGGEEEFRWFRVGEVLRYEAAESEAVGRGRGTCGCGQSGSTARVESTASVQGQGSRSVTLGCHSSYRVPV
jgi:hypothetical protein